MLFFCSIYYHSSFQHRQHSHTQRVPRHQYFTIESAMKISLLISVVLHLWRTEATLSPRGTADTTSLSGSRSVLLDVDNTLYREREAGIESQIVSGTHSYCQDILGIDKETADQYYRQFGSTVVGLERTIWKDLSTNELQEKLEEFYRGVWKDVDPSSALLRDTDAGTGSTGYSHASKEERKLTRQLLKFSPIPLALASNSPSWHVCKVVRALGLEKVFRTCQTFTPDRLPLYPTKHQPEEFFSKSDDDSGLSKDRTISFFDDSLHNLKRIQESFPTLVERVHQINRQQNNDESSDIDIGEENLVQALLQDFGLIKPTFRLSQTRYLESKNIVDRKSLHIETWNKVVKQLKETLVEDGNETSYADNQVWIADVGAGLLSMLDLLLHGDDELGLLALLSVTDSFPVGSNGKTVNYMAYESNQELYESSHERLLSWGFGVIENSASNGDKTTDVIDYQKEQNGVVLRVKLILRNFADAKNDELFDVTERVPPNLIIGCCFADLMDPEQLVPDLLRSFGLLNASSKSTLMYFPITFTGTTQFLPPQPCEFRSNGNTVPSDTVGFQSYSRALDTVLGHNLDPYFLQDVMEEYGARLIDFGSSDWKIDPERDSYLYETMLYFFGSTGGPQLLKEGWDGPGWIQRAHNNRPSIQVSNRDLLFCIEANEQGNANENSDSKSKTKEQMAEILFIAPNQVTSVKKDIPSELGPRQIRSKYCRIKMLWSVGVCLTR